MPIVRSREEQCCCQELETQGRGQGRGLELQGRGQGQGVKLQGQGQGLDVQDEDEDLSSKDEDKNKESSFEDKDKDEDFSSKDKDKDLKIGPRGSSRTTTFFKDNDTAVRHYGEIDMNFSLFEISHFKTEPDLGP